MPTTSVRLRVPPYTLREALLADLPTLVRHRRKMWEDIGEHTAAQPDAADPVYRRWAASRLRSGSLVGWIGETDGGTVASGCLWIQRVQPAPDNPRGQQPYLLSMYTVPEHRGKGLAQQIVRRAKAWSAEQGFRRVRLHAAAMGRRIYEKEGFERTWEMRVTL